MRPPRVAVIGGRDADPSDEAAAERVGRALAEGGAVVVGGGLGGVMAAAARGARDAGGRTLAFLPGDDPGAANPWVELPVATGMGEGRNVLVVRAAQSLVAVGGGWGTLSEIALARALGRPVVTLGRPPAEGLGLPAAASPEEAAAWALARAAEGKPRAGA